MNPITLEEIAEMAQQVIDLKADAEGEMNRVRTENDLFPPSKYYVFFRRLAARMRPRLSVVLGVCGGGDCYHLCLGNPDGKVIGVDIAYDHPPQMEFIQAHCPGFQFLQRDSILAAAEIYQAHGMVDFLFIDTSHEKEQMLAEFNAWIPYLSPAAVVCFDDLFRPGMEEGWLEIPRPRMRADLLHDGHPDIGGGFGIWRAP